MRPQHVEHGVEVGVDHRLPVLDRHFQEHAIAGDAGVVDQHVDGTVLGHGLAESFGGGVPIGHIADRSVKGVTLGFLLAQPFVKVTAGAAARNDLVAHLVQTMANGGPDAAHAACDVCDFLTHVLVSLWLF